MFSNPSIRTLYPLETYTNSTIKMTNETKCDASMKDLGAYMMQNGQPIYYDIESIYSNIEHEMLGVVFALTRFHQYTYGRTFIVVIDHKLLELLTSAASLIVQLVYNECCSDYKATHTLLCTDPCNRLFFVTL